MRPLSTTLALLITSQICVHSTMTGLRMAAPLWALREGYSSAAVGVLLALFALGSLALALPAGHYADRHGLRRPLVWCIATACLAGALPMVWPRFETLLAGALLAGSACGGALIALQRHAGRIAHDATELRQVFSWLALGPAISNFLGPFFSGLLIDHAGDAPGSDGGYRAAFALLALLPLVAWVTVSRLEELPRVMAPAGGRKERTWDLLREPRFRNLLLVNWCLSSCWDVHTFVVPLLGHELGLAASTIGTVLGAFALATAFIRMIMPLVANRLKEGQVVTGAMVVTALLFFVYPFSPGAVMMIVCSTLLGLSLGMVQPMLMSMLHQITPEHQHGAALGLRLMTINASNVAMPMLFGSAGAMVGVSGVFWAVGAMVGGGARVAWRLGKQARHQEPPSAPPPPAPPRPAARRTPPMHPEQ